MEKYLTGIDFIPIQRHNGIDAILKEYYNNAPILIRIQRNNESLRDAYQKLNQAVNIKKSQKSFLIQTHNKFDSLIEYYFDNPKIYVIKNISLMLSDE